MKMNKMIRGSLIVVTTIALMLLMLIITGATLAWIAPDAVPQITHTQEYKESRLWEDGSYQVTLGAYTITGCAPIHLWNDELVIGWCLDGGHSWLGEINRGQFEWSIGIDSPWEDFLPSPLDDIVYWMIQTFIK